MEKWLKLFLIALGVFAVILSTKLSLSGWDKTITTFVNSNIAMLFAGTLMHFLMGLSGLQKESEHPLTLTETIKKQWRSRSADVLLGIIGAFAGYAIISEMHMLNSASALGAGYM